MARVCPTTAVATAGQFCAFSGTRPAARTGRPTAGARIGSEPGAQGNGAMSAVPRLFFYFCP